MHSVLSGFLPIWTITAFGWAAGRFNLLGDQAQQVLGRFAFTFAMPSLLFLTMAKSRPGELAQPGVVVFALSLLAVFAAGLVASRRLFRRKKAEQAIGAMAASYVNSANLGIPVAVHVLHDTSFIVAAALFQMLFITPLILVLIELDVRRDAGRRWLRMLQLPIRNPVVGASAAGVAVAALGLNLPDEVTSPLTILGGGAVPAALFALGMSLTVRAAADPGEGAERGLLVALKIAVQPLLAYALGRWAFGLGGHELFAVVLCAGLPTAQNAFIFASEYRLDTSLPRDTVLLSTLLSMASLSLIAVLLG
ncbi:AEC family transporter [Streptomyces sp. WM6378]|uniref:AEC family transporter n=1 Tax=Streptomyces sp. WM6378 TaxID=1415557 RepID=UPI000B075562|nr:AEC family transporter [Streptomyces sp. WM6378]